MPRHGAKSEGGFLATLDMVQVLSMAMLLTIGLVFIRSTGIQVGGDQPLQAFHRQIIWITGGVLLWLACSRLDHRSFSFTAITLLAYCGVVCLLIVVLFAGVKIYGARRWLGFAGLGLQPSEFAKVTVVAMLAVMCSFSGFSMKKTSGLLAFCLIAGVPLLLVAMEPDFGGSMIFVAILAAVVLAAGLPWKKIAVTTVVLAIFCALAVANETLRIRPVLRDYQRERILVFLDPERDRLNTGYNAYQARLAVGSGGSYGKGIGQGTQNLLGFIPQTVSNNDFIFSVIAEETGFAGVAVLLATYSALLYSIVRTAAISKDVTGHVLGAGIAAIFFSHMFINIGMSLGITPVTGLSLPLVSYGGSFVLAGMMALGLMQSVYRRAKLDEMGE